ncbi:MAG: tetraspanin family protein [Thermoleophilaceae bacterium]|nr:tetraspanin family protein [Thermoleophilaceae bacterium]
MTAPIALSTLAIVLIVVGAVILIMLILGFLGAWARSRRQAPSYDEHVAAADAALEQARAADKGWSREVMEEAARAALDESRPSWTYRELHLVLVDDRPGVHEDRAHFMAVGDDGEARVILARHEDRWVAERVE